MDDLAALRLAVTMLRRDAMRSAQLDRLIAEDGWYRAAQFAAYYCQIEKLKLKPWQDPPCCANLGQPMASELLASMLAAGISRWHPDPRAAISEAEKV